VPPPKSSFLDKVLGRIGRLDREGLQTVVQRLARERSFLETLFNTIEDGVLVIDERGRILYLNEAVGRLLGLQAQTAEGQHIAQFLPDLDWEKLSHFDKAGGTRVTRHELEVHYPRQRFLSLYVAPLDGEAIGSLGVALIIHDATEARQRTHEAIESERIQALTLLAASVAHEIGNPLNALHIHLQLMERELKKFSMVVAEMASERGMRNAERGTAPRSAFPVPRSQEALQIAHRLDRYLHVSKGEISRLDYIVTQFLQAIRPSPPQLRLSPVNDVVKETIELLRPEIENRGITIREKLARQLPATPIDPAQIKQALVNLTKNAIQAMTRGGVLTLQTEQAGDGVVVTVADTGGGIPREKINRIFEPFYTTKKKGTGLGLMIVQRIVRDHGGRIDLESHVGQGTVFRVWLPLFERQTKLLEARHD
jgi:PAS domain S-box-containing protein